MSTGGGRAEAQQAVRRARHTASQARIAAANRAFRQAKVRAMFALPVRDCASLCVGRPVSVLRAGRYTPMDELGLSQLQDSGFEVVVMTVDQGGPVNPADTGAGDTGAGDTGAGDTGAGDVRVGDLRTVPMPPPRSFDIVYCGLLLHQVAHVELVLDRFVTALRPGGLLLLRIRDRDCAIGLLDRALPQWARRLLWAGLAPGQPGPLAAVYEKAASDRSIQAYMQTRGLVISQRETARTLPSGPGRTARVVSVACRVICRLTRGRLTDAHDEVLYVIRKPEDRFARVV